MAGRGTIIQFASGAQWNRKMHHNYADALETCSGVNDDAMKPSSRTTSRLTLTAQNRHTKMQSPRATIGGTKYSRPILDALQLYIVSM